MAQSQNLQLCKMFQLMASWTMERTSAGIQYGVELQEETVTESILLKLARQQYFGVNVEPFDKRDEGLNGADWEFWFTDINNFIVKIRIQAKRLFKTGRYRRLRTKEGKAQLQRLTNSAALVGATPLYVFYNNDKFPFPIQSLWPLQLWGCSMAPPSRVSGIVQGRPSSVLEMRPWHLLFCPGTNILNMTLPKIVEASLKVNFDQNIAPVKDEAEYWKTMLRGGADNLPKYYEDNELRGILLFDDIRAPDRQKH